MKMILSKRFKNRRKELGFTQKELAEGICEQSLISRVEKLGVAPTSDILFALSQRLQVSMDYFFDESVSDKAPDITVFKRLVDKALFTRSYDQLAYLVEAEKQKEAVHSQESSEYLTYLACIVDFHHYHKEDTAIVRMEELSHRISKTSSFYLDVYNSLVNFYALTSRDEDLDGLYEGISEKLSHLDISNTECFHKYIKIRYNHAHYLFKRKRQSQAIDELTDLIEILRDKKSCYLLADTLCLIANVGEGFLSKDEILSYYREAECLFKFFGPQNSYLSLKEYLSKDI